MDSTFERVDMTSRDFAYWLQGYLEINGAQSTDPARPVRHALNPLQVDVIQNHLALVFLHEIDLENAQKADAQVAQAVHDGKLQIGGTDAQGNKYRC
jgi:hypothetical protein